ncbi:MAG: hypothetical protein ACK5RL_03520 [Acidimicrobiales bacterium]
MITSAHEALPTYQFAEHHHRVLNADREAGWRAIHETRWGDVRWTAPFFVVRGLGAMVRGGSSDSPRIVEKGPVARLWGEAPRYLAMGSIMRPYALRQTEPDPEVSSLEELATFDRPGWVKVAMDFRLTDLGDGRTRLDTSTLCQATDRTTDSRFGRYWRVIRPFSGLIRVEILAAIANRAEQQSATA